MLWIARRFATGPAGLSNNVGSGRTTARGSADPARWFQSVSVSCPNRSSDDRWYRSDGGNAIGPFATRSAHTESLSLRGCAVPYVRPGHSNQVKYYEHRADRSSGRHRRPDEGCGCIAGRCRGAGRQGGRESRGRRHRRRGGDAALCRRLLGGSGTADRMAHRARLAHQQAAFLAAWRLAAEQFRSLADHATPDTRRPLSGL